MVRRYGAVAFAEGLAVGVGSQGRAILVRSDFVGNVRVDGAWGSAQVMGVVKHIQAGYYGTTTTGWRGFKKAGFPAKGWVIESGRLKQNSTAAAWTVSSAGSKRRWP